VSGNIGSIKRIAGSGTPGNTTFTVTFSDGSTSRPVEVKLSGAAAAGC
jgi:hypothetical protein